MIVRWQTDQKKRERWKFKVCPPPPPNRLRSEANQNSPKVQYRSYVSFIFLSFSDTFFFLYPSTSIAPLFSFPMSLSVQWIICLLLANVTPLLTGLTGSQSHTTQHRSWTWLLKVLLKFLSNFLYRGRCDYRNWLEVSLFFFLEVAALALVPLRWVL